MAYDFLHVAERMLATPSVSSEGTAELVDYLCHAVVPHLPGDHALLREADGRDVSLLVVVPGRDPLPPLLLNSHLDTVPPGEARAWTATGGDPYRPRTDGDRLFGLGSADAKLDWLCKAEAVRRATGGELRRPIQLLGTYGEERGLLGARSFLQQDRAPRAAAALVGEPTECLLVTQHKGLLVGVLRLEAEPQPVVGDGFTSRTRRYKGRAAHSAMPQHGESAILQSLNELADETPVIAIRGGDAANKVAAWCNVEIASTRRHRSGTPQPAPEDVQPMSPVLLAAARDFAAVLGMLAEHEGREDHAFTPPRLTTNIGRIDGRGSTLSLTFDVRCLPGDDGGVLRSRVADIAAQLEATYVGIRASIVVEREDAPLPPAPTEVIEPALAALAAAGLPRRFATKAGCTEAGLYASRGIPAAVFGAGRAAGNIHAPNECTSVAQLRQAVEFYVAFIGAFCRR